ncbi:Phospholipase D1 [Ascosphaera atra]|nr:Phospholipase D1 [Ascosphaera atra]
MASGPTAVMMQDRSRSPSPELLRQALPEDLPSSSISIPPQQQQHTSPSPDAASSNGANGSLHPREHGEAATLRKPQSSPSLPAANTHQAHDGDDDATEADHPIPRPASAASARSLSRVQAPDTQSVQFAPGTSQPHNRATSAPHSRASSVIQQDDEEGLPRVSMSLFSKLRAFAANTPFPSHNRSYSASAVEQGAGGDTRATPGATTPVDEEDEFRAPRSRSGAGEEDSDADADAESDSGERREARPKRKRIWRRPAASTTDATGPGGGTPNTPGFMPSMWRSRSFTPAETQGRERSRPAQFRRALSSFAPYGREGVSEDEGRDRLKKERRRDQWLQSARGLYLMINPQGWYVFRRVLPN